MKKYFQSAVTKGVHTALWSPLLKWKRLQRLSETAVWQDRLSEVRRQIVPDSRSSWTEGSVAEVGARPTDEKRTSVSQTITDTKPGDERLKRQVFTADSSRKLVGMVRTWLGALSKYVRKWICIAYHHETISNTLFMSERGRAYRQAVG